MKRITIYKISINNNADLSTGQGYDDEGNLIDFRGKTSVMRKIQEDLEDFEDDPITGRPSVYLEAWQWED
jgi:hypothetical protein